MNGRLDRPGKAVPTMVSPRRSSERSHPSTINTLSGPGRGPRPRRRIAAALGAVALGAGLSVGLAGNALAAAPAPAAVSPNLSTTVAPGGNFNLSVWELQLPTGSAGAPTTILPAQLEGAGGFQDSYFYTNSTDGGMQFWDPENGVTTPNSSYSRSELREMTSSGAAANWFAAGTTNTLTARVRVIQVPNHVCVGQIHLGSGGSTKPLLELFYYANGNIEMAIEQTPAGGNEIQYLVGNVPLGTTWGYTIGLSNSTISLSINSGATRTWTASSTFDGYGMYFKAGDYDQSTGSSSTVGAKVEFYKLDISHS
jgi:hypothetical protein